MFYFIFQFFFFYLFLYLFICVFFFFFFNDTATTEIYTLSLHDALPLSTQPFIDHNPQGILIAGWTRRSEEHTSELQSRSDLVCRLLLEKKKKQLKNQIIAKKKIIKKNRYNNLYN